MRELDRYPAELNVRLRHHVEKISGARHGLDDYFELEKRADYIEEQFSHCRFPVQHQYFHFKGNRYRNVIATVDGKRPELPPLVVGAHYDGNRGTVGADDNASGVAVLLETALYLCLVAPKRPIRLVAFTLEEPQTFTHIFRRGSRFFARMARRERTRYEGAVILECVGYTAEQQHGATLSKLIGMKIPERGDFLAVVANQSSKRLMQEFVGVAAQAVPSLPVASYAAPAEGYLLPQIRFSDHASFWEQNYPAIMLNDTVMFRNPHYHKPSDTPETLDFNFMEKVTLAVAAFATGI